MRRQDNRVSLLLLLLLLLGLCVAAISPTFPEISRLMTTTTTPAPIPCNETYQITLKESDGLPVFTWGHYAEYYVSGGVFVYLYQQKVGSNTHGILVARNDDTILWTTNVTEIYLNQITVDQRNGDIYIVYMTYDENGFFEKYQIDGTLVWSIDITYYEPNMAFLSFFDTAILIDVEHNSLYFSPSLFNGSYYTNTFLFSFDMDNGDVNWANQQSFRFNSIVYDTTRALIYAWRSYYNGISYFDTDGTYLGLVSNSNNAFAAMTINSDGDVYAHEKRSDGRATVSKFNSSHLFQWRTVLHTNASIEGYSQTVGGRTIVYDHLNDLLIVACVFEIENRNIYIATVSPSDGTLLTYLEIPEYVGYNLRDASIVPYFEARTIFVTFQKRNIATSTVQTYELKAFCY